MKGLLLKDWYCAVKLCKSLFFIDIVFLVAAIFGGGNPFFLLFPCLTAGLLTMSLISYEEHDGWDRYAATLPYTRAEIVSWKYELSLMNVFAVGTLAAIVQAVLMIRTRSFTLPGYASAVLLLFSVGLVSPAILCPFLYRFGVTKGRIVYYFFIGAGCAISTFLSTSGETLSISRNGRGIAIGMFAAAVLLYGVSWMLSIHFYQKREL